MHRSQLAGFIIDCQTSDLKTAAEFWSKALGMEQKAATDQPEKYVQLVDPRDYVHVEVQSVAHPSRVHLDIEADDVEAEVRRLEQLGAKRIQQVRTWWVMEAPTGQRFCVVRPQQAGFASTAHRWS
jgi:predicted enzyme related to lactoylglutathione lyase